MKLAIGFASVAWMLISSLAYAGQYEYKIRSIAPNTTDSKCHEKIYEVGLRFAEMTGVNVTSTACYVSQFEEKFLDGVISYTANEKVKVTQFLQYGNFGIEDTAMYRSEKSCLDAIPSQTALFATQTGLTPHISYCYRKSLWTEERWYLQIEAAGTSETNHYFMGVYVHGEPAQGYESYWEEISKNIMDRGLTISKASFVNQGLFNRLTIGYYAEEIHHIHNSEDVRLPSPEECSAAKERAKVAFAKLPNPPIAIFCGKKDRGLRGGRLNIYTLETQVYDAADFKHTVLPGVYRSFEACQQDRGEQVSRLEASGVQVVEAFCGIDSNNRFVLNGYIRKP